jgi:hypothetical protein
MRLAFCSGVGSPSSLRTVERSNALFPGVCVCVCVCVRAHVCVCVCVTCLKDGHQQKHTLLGLLDGLGSHANGLCQNCGHAKLGLDDQVLSFAADNFRHADSRFLLGHL